MPSYFFDLTTDTGLVRDAEGTVLRDDAEASEHARSVVRELMRGREAETQAWHLDVYDVSGRRCLELQFGNADAALFPGIGEDERGFPEYSTEMSGA